MLTRKIHPEFETVGKRRRMVGVRAQILDGSTVIYDRTHANYSDADRACDTFVHDLLSSDLVLTATELDGAQPDHA